MELTGKIKVIMDPVTFEKSGFTKREFVVTVEGQFKPQQIKFELVQDKCSIVDKYNPGEEITVHFDIRGNEYQDRYFVNLQAWRIEAAQGTQVPQISTPKAVDAGPFPDAPEPFVSGDGEEASDDLPF